MQAVEDVKPAHEITFASHHVFNDNSYNRRLFRPHVDSCSCVVSRMIFSNVINIDGSIDDIQVVNLTVGHLWSYVFYLYTYNHTTSQVFSRMKSDGRNRANAGRFLAVVIQDTSRGYVAEPSDVADVSRLIYFVNKTIHESNTALINPIIDYMQRLLSRKLDDSTYLHEMRRVVESASAVPHHHRAPPLDRMRLEPGGDARAFGIEQESESQSESGSENENERDSESEVNDPETASGRRTARGRGQGQGRGRGRGRGRGQGRGRGRAMGYVETPVTLRGR